MKKEEDEEEVKRRKKVWRLEGGNYNSNDDSIMKQLRKNRLNKTLIRDFEKSKVNKRMKPVWKRSAKWVVDGLNERGNIKTSLVNMSPDNENKTIKALHLIP